MRNGPDATSCVQCGRDRRRSAVAPPDNMDPNHPGLTIVTTDNFVETVLDDTKHVFLDVTGDWCGPSVAMKQDWYALASALKDVDEVVIAQMDTDKVSRSHL